MDRLKAMVIGAVFLLTAGPASADVIYSNFSASNGFNKNDAITILQLQPFPPVSPSVSTFVSVPFQVPPGITYLLTEVDVAVSVPSGDSSLRLSVSAAGFSTLFSFPEGVDLTLPLLIQIPVPATTILDPGLYTIDLSIYDPGGSNVVNWYFNDAGVEGTFTSSFFPMSDPSHPLATATRSSTGRFPVFRLLGETSEFYNAPLIAPAYSSFATTESSQQATYATVELEVICPGPTPQFTCSVGFFLNPPVTPAQACGDVAAAINQFAATAPLGSCWPLSGLIVDPSQFHADCDGDSVRVTNSTVGLCEGAFVCIDGLNNLTKFAALPRQRTISYEYDSVTGPLVLDLRGAVSGIAGDPSRPSGIKVVHRRLLSGRTFEANVHLPAGSTPGQIGSALAAVLRGDSDEVSATATGLRFQPREPYDVTLWVNDSGLSWALSPFTDLLARSSLSTNPAPVVQPTCSSDPTRLCLRHGRFQVEVSWHTAQGSSGVGLVATANDESGSFSFFAGDNVEIVAKIVDACTFANKVWFFAAGMTNVGVDLTVTDTLTGQVHTYHNATDTAFQPILDTGSFGGCPVF